MDTGVNFEHKTVMDIQSILKAFNATEKLLTSNVKALKRSNVERLAKNREYLFEYVKDWYNNVSKSIFNKYAVELTEEPFVSHTDYPVLKRALCAYVAAFDASAIVGLLELLRQYEVVSDKKYGVPPENSAAYSREISDAGRTYSKAVKYIIIEVDGDLTSALSTLTGQELLDIAYFLKDAPLIKAYHSTPV